MQRQNETAIRSMLMLELVNMAELLSSLLWVLLACSHLRKA